MLDVIREYVRAAPCVWCLGSADLAVVWTLSTAAIVEELGGDPSRSRRLLYRICSGCARQVSAKAIPVAAVEERVLEIWRAGRVHRFRDGQWTPG
jgi:hypothetical protein